MIDPVESTTVYVIGAEGVFKSTNGGQNWTAIDQGLNGRIYSLVIDPSNSATLYACNYFGAFKSTNGGQIWLPINNGLPSTYPYLQRLAIDPLNPSAIYAGGLFGGFFKTANGGLSWTVSNSGMALSARTFVSITVNPTNPQTVYAGANDGIFKSVDGGQTWLAINPHLLGLTNVNSIAIDPASPATLYVGTDAGVFKTTDGGQTLVATSNGIGRTSALSVEVEAGNPAVLYANGGLLHKSIDGGETWSVVHDHLRCFVVDPANSSVLYGCFRGEIVRSTDGGQTWSTITSQLERRNVALIVIDPLDPSTIYAGSGQGGGGMFKSTDNGHSWTPINAGLSSSFGIVFALAIDPKSPSTLYTYTTGGMYKSTNAGQHWTPINNGLASQPDQTAIQTLAIDPVNPTIVYAGAIPGRIYKTVDGGEGWVSVSTGLPNSPAVTSIVIDPITPTTVYAGINGQRVFGSGVFKTTNGGQTWTAMNTGLPITDIGSLAVDKGNPSVLYAGTVGAGVFKSSNGGQTWQATGSKHAAPSVSVNAILNAASNLAGQIAPGEIVVLKGVDLGPAQIVQFRVSSAGLVETHLAGTRVLFNGIPAPIIYTSGRQVAAIVPYSIETGAAKVTVTYQGQTSEPFGVTVGQAAPGLFTLDSTGQGQAAAVNQDGSINTAGHPASMGSIILLFATGEGQTSPAGVDGKPAQVPLPRPLLAVSVTIGGRSAVVHYAGGAPGNVAGLMQINAQIPDGLTAGENVPVVIQVGNVLSQSGVSIVVGGN